MQEPNYNLTDGNGNVIAQLGTNSNGDFIVEHSSGDQAVFNDDGLQVPAIDTGSITIDESSYSPADGTVSILTFDAGSVVPTTDGFQQTTAVDTSATVVHTIPNAANQTAGLVLVVGDSGNDDIFNDLVWLSRRGASLSVVAQLDASGSPSSRSYSTPDFSADLELAMGAGTYDVVTRSTVVGGNV